MVVRHAQQLDEEAPEVEDLEHHRAPGKRTLTMSMPGGGGPLPAPVAAQMGRAFDADFSHVRMHQGDHVTALGARAYALGHEVHFAPGQFDPHSHDGLALIGHELAHVVQQGQTRVAPAVQAKGAAVSIDEALEAEADRAGEQAARGDRVAAPLSGYSPLPISGAAVQGKLIRRPAPTSSESKGSVVDNETAEAALIDAAHELGITPATPAAKRLVQVVHGDDDRIEVAHDATRRAMASAIVAYMNELAKREAEEGGGEEPSRKEAPLSAALPAILDELIASGQYIFNNPPLESAGDIYHTIGFLAILREAQLPLPRVVIGYHPPATAASPTWKNADRGASFAAAVGFGAQVSMLEIPKTKVGHLNTKLQNTRNAIAADDKAASRTTHPILDQKASTALISQIMQALGRDRVSEIIGRQLATYRGGDGNEAATPAASLEWQRAQLAKIEAIAGDGPLVLFNERIAGNQGQHNSEGPEFDAIKAALVKRKIAHYTLRAHGGDAAEGEEDASSPAFAGTGANGKGNARGFNTKVQHLQLLRLIQATFGARLVGIYGSTSGTLDAAALVGIRTLSLHAFSIDRKHKESGRLNEQDQRELLMSPFKSVVRRPATDEKARDGDDEELGDAEVGDDELGDEDLGEDELARGSDEKHRAMDDAEPTAPSKSSGDDMDAIVAQWLDGAYAGPTFDAGAVGGLAPVYSDAITMGDGPAKKAKSKTKKQKLADKASKRKIELGSLAALLDPARGGLDEALNVTLHGNAQVVLRRGEATGVGMDCLIHTMVQLGDNREGAPDARVAEIRRIMVATGTARADQMLDPYQNNAGAALMEQFRQAGFSTQILQWTGGAMRIHPVIGVGPVRLLLHSGAHFEPLWGNNGTRVIANVDTAPAVGGGLDPELQRAILASLQGGT